MINELEQLAILHGDRLKVIPIDRLKELKKIIDEFKETEELNDFQKWIVNSLYQFEVPDKSLQVNSIILMAVHHPFYAKVQFQKDGNTKTFLSLVWPDFQAAENYLVQYLKEQGYFLKPADALPLKRLGAHSGLAKYGRNNITYVEGLGSNFSYAAYYSDLICEQDTWGDALTAELCSKCTRCIENCPTGAIREDRFLINNQRCLSAINEVPGEFPDWLPKTVHHTLYDCLICQRVCPMNMQQIDQSLEGISFTEEETAMLLEGKPFEAFSKETQDKMSCLGMFNWFQAIPRNLKMLFEQSGN